jgi:hypothetical protein
MSSFPYGPPAAMQANRFRSRLATTAGAGRPFVSNSVNSPRRSAPMFWANMQNMTRSRNRVATGAGMPRRATWFARSANRPAISSVTSAGLVPGSRSFGLANADRSSARFVGSASPARGKAWTSLVVFGKLV